MFGENLKTLRKNKGITQEELAARLNVVRQTVSKWEKGQSVPDAEMLAKLAEIFEVPVSMLLGSRIEPDAQPDALAEQLARINEQLETDMDSNRSNCGWGHPLTIACVWDDRFVSCCYAERPNGNR